MASLSQGTRYAVRYGVVHALSQDDPDYAVRLLTSLGYIQAKCAAGMTSELHADYDAVLATLPESRREQDTQRETDERLAAYARDLIRYGRAWSERRNNSPDARGQNIPELPSPPVAVRPLSDAELGAQAMAVATHPSRLDRVTAFARFAAAQSHAFIPFASRPGFCLQQAYNAARTGPVAEAAQARLGTACPAPLILQKAATRPPFRLRPALARTFEGHSQRVRCVAMTPDGRWAASAGDDKVVRVWDLRRGHCIKELGGQSDRLFSMALTPDARLVVAGDCSGRITAWETEHGGCLSSFEAHDGAVFGLAVSPDGGRALSGGADRMVRLWDPRTGGVARDLPDEGQLPVNCVAMTPDGRLGISGHDWDPREKGSLTAIVNVWDLEGGRRRDCLWQSTTVRCVALSPDARIAIAGDARGRLNVWNLQTGGKPIREIEGHTESVQGCALTPDGRLAISVGSDCLLRVWDMETGDGLRCLEGHTTGADCVEISADGRWAISAGGEDNRLLLWDLEAGEKTDRSAAHIGAVHELEIGPWSRTAVSVGRDEALQVWDLESGRSLRRVESVLRFLGALAVGDRQGIAAAVSPNRDLGIWDLRSGRCLHRVGGPEWFSGLTLTPDDRFAVSVRTGGVVDFWDLSSGQRVRARSTKLGRNGSVRFLTDGRYALLHEEEGSLRVWDTETDKYLQTIILRTGDRYAVPTPDASAALLAASGATLRVWNLRTGHCTQQLRGAEGCFERVSIAPCGRSFICFEETLGESAFEVWDLRAGLRRHRLQGHAHAISAWSWSPDGYLLFTAGWDNTVRIWDLDSGECRGVYHDPHAITAISAVVPSGHLAVGTATGEVKFLELRNISLEAPLVTAGRRWRISETAAPGRWDDRLTARCPWCGARFAAPSPVLEAIDGIGRGARLLPDEPLCLTLPEEAWNEPRLRAGCASCGRPVRFNPFVVDHQEGFTRRAPRRRPISLSPTNSSVHSGRAAASCWVCKGDCGEPAVLLADGRTVGADCLIQLVENEGAWVVRETGGEPCCVCLGTEVTQCLETPVGMVCERCAACGLEAVADAEHLAAWPATQFARSLSPDGRLAKRLTVLWRLKEVFACVEHHADIETDLLDSLVCNLGFDTPHPFSARVRQLALEGCRGLGRRVLPSLLERCPPEPWQLLANVLLAAGTIAPENEQVRNRIERAATDERSEVRRRVPLAVSEPEVAWSRSLVERLLDDPDQSVGAEALVWCPRINLTIISSPIRWRHVCSSRSFVCR